MKELATKITLAVSIVASTLNVVWIVVLNDYSYVLLAAPLSLLGAVALVGAGLLRWRPWHLLLAPPLLIPFLPWAEWMYG